MTTKAGDEMERPKIYQWAAFMRAMDADEVMPFMDAQAAKIKRLNGENQRLKDLVRYQRFELFEEKLISAEEHTALVSDSDTGSRVARLESYDQFRIRAEATESTNASLVERVKELEGQIEALRNYWSVSVAPAEEKQG